MPATGRALQANRRNTGIWQLTRDNNSYRESIGNAGDGLAQPRTRHKPFFLRAFFDVERPLR